MNSKVRPNKDEGGITLISLIVMIILLVILAAVTLRGVTGQEGILGSTTSAVQRYSIEEYREKIAETAQKTILASAILRRRSKY